MTNTLRSISVILITTLLFSCATVQKAVVVKKPRIVASEYVEACAPLDESAISFFRVLCRLPIDWNALNPNSYYMRELNAKVLRSRNCLKVKDPLAREWFWCGSGETCEDFPARI